MNYQMPQNKFLKKILVLLLSMPLLIQSISFQVAYAQDAKQKTPPTCDELGIAEKTKGWIISITEENISNATDKQGSQDDRKVLNCYRENTLTKGKWNPKYKQTCSPTADVNAEGKENDIICQKVQVFLAQSGTELLYVYMSRIYKWAAGTIGIVSVLFLVWGGIEISAAQGDSGKIEKAKGRIQQSLAGLVLLFLSALFLYTINPNFFIIG